MFRLLRSSRLYCKQVSNSKCQVAAAEAAREKINFDQVIYNTKVPQQPIQERVSASTDTVVEIDSSTIQLLERLSLVDLDSKEALATLKSSIQFADKIVNIDTEGVPPLYTVLKDQNLQLRPDCLTEGNCREEILRNAKVTDEDYFVSPPGNIPLEQNENKHLIEA